MKTRNIVTTAIVGTSEQPSHLERMGTGAVTPSRFEGVLCFYSAFGRSSSTKAWWTAFAWVTARSSDSGGEIPAPDIRQNRSITPYAAKRLSS